MKERSRTARPRLGIIGSGIAGLTAAWLLKERFEVTLFEAHERPGMGAFTAELPLAEGHHLVDVPTRVFCAGYYPQLYQLLAHIGVELEATDHAAAYADEQGKTYFHYANLRLLGRSISRLSLRSARSPKALKMAWAAQRFFAQVRADQRRLPALQNISFERYLQQSQSSADFVDGLLMPALCVILTCSPEEARAYPADLLLAYLGSGVMQQGVMRASLGVGDVVDRLIGGVQLRCGTRVAEVRPGKTSSTVLLEDGHREDFAQVVMAAQAQHSAQMLPPEHGAAALLQTVPWARSQMLVHTDTSTLLAARAPVQYRVGTRDEAPEVSVHMGRSFPSYRALPPVVQVWNPQRSVDESQVLGLFEFTRPLVNLQSRQAMAQLRELQGQGGLWFAGAYVADKVPLLEAAVSSALAVAQGLGVRPPWTTEGL